MHLLQAVTEPRRMEILRLIWTEELSAGEVAAHFDVSFPAVSQHLKVLRDAGAVRVRPQGTKRFYRADHSSLGPVARMLETMWSSDLDRLARAAEDLEETDD